MVRGIVIRIGLDYSIREYYEGIWYSLIRRYGLIDYEGVFRVIFWYMYDIDSPYYELSITERLGRVFEYEGGIIGLDRGFCELVGGVIEDFWGDISIFLESQDERVYRSLRDRIDRLILEYSNSSVDLKDLELEPKRVKAISDLIQIKGKLGNQIGIRNRGLKEENLIERM